MAYDKAEKLRAWRRGAVRTLHNFRHGDASQPVSTVSPPIPKEILLVKALVHLEEHSALPKS